MSAPFVWFDNMGPAREDTTTFLNNVFGWAPNDIGPMTMLTPEGAQMPFGATCDSMEAMAGWVPYVEVDDLGQAVRRAREHGAEIVTEDVPGPAGIATFIRDPGGAPMALWKRAAG